jgi:hypothetical protein
LFDEGLTVKKSKCDFAEPNRQRLDKLNRTFVIVLDGRINYQQIRIALACQANRAAEIDNQTAHELTG